MNYRKLSELISLRTGLNFSQSKWHDLGKALQRAREDFGFKDVEALVSWLLSSRLTGEDIQRFACHITVGETYFFREKSSLEALQGHILPRVIQAKETTGSRAIRIWSAGCSTGEEAYTIAIILRKLLPDIHTYKVSISATDINPLFLKKAAEGIYTQWSFRGTPDWVRQECFTPTPGGRFALRPELQRMPSFSTLNLAEDTYPSADNNTQDIDVILCRNVLMYFSEEEAIKVARRFYRALVSGGWLITGQTELSTDRLFEEFEAVVFPDAVLYRKPPEMPTPPLVIETTPVRDTKQDNAHTLSEVLLKYEQGRFDEVEEILLRLPALNRGEAGALALLARVYANKGMLDRAMEHCQRAIEADNLNAAYHYLAATILEERGQVQEAMTALNRAIYIDQGHALAHFAMGNLFLRQGHYSQCQRHFSNALKILASYSADDLLPESEGIPVGRLREMIETSMAYVKITLSKETMT
ncbi:methylase of chemotaxis methyl-accepting protein [Candidatus Magnetobacterium bavaricum]|uniref:Methylase of chemotaxis methyl-accepting protein n=1 Tax=Candidatus Magnetobacterium bavaricum TaxID=29290 RepID=A0A0F3GNZ8_9BACT|nr:methylase of chemotaxis methyl-accepting protein [Candidatus Magnetobacterium bavaricum]